MSTLFYGKGAPIHKGEFASIGTYDFPIVIRQNVSLDELRLIGFSETRQSEQKHRSATVHFFEDDDKFDEVWNNPPKYVAKLRQYRQVLSPDFSQYGDMPAAIQIFNVYRNRWCAAYWQQQGLVVIPTISWSDNASLAYSFDSIERNSCVAVSTVGCANNEDAFMAGYVEMVARIEPTAVICYGRLFSDMDSHATCIEIEYRTNTTLSYAVHI
jgi:hypothetical protein